MELHSGIHVVEDHRRCPKRLLQNRLHMDVLPTQVGRIQNDPPVEVHGPRATNPNGSLQTDADWKCVPTVIKRGVSIGSGATLLCGITVGERSIIGAGAVVTKDVPPGVIVVGNPAKVLRKI